MGSLVTAVASYLHIKQQRGHWHVRIDDIDPPRQDPGAIESILGSLYAHGLQPDAPVQYLSQHQASYTQALQTLGPHLFYCRCSRRSLQGQKVYPGTCRSYQQPRDDSAVRFAVGDVQISYVDGFTGLQRVNLATETGDFIVRRRDGLVGYNLATAVDDGSYQQILRGQDLQPVTPMQIVLMQTLKLDIPAYTHIPVLCFADGTKLSKQTHAPPLQNQQAAANVANALRYLNHPPPAGLSVAELLSWGVANWQLSAVPAKLPVYAA